MANYVLVAGAWLGAWAWDEVAEELRAAGHGVYPLTLSGLADKRGVAPAGQEVHVRDIVAEVERLDLRDVVLVGHSYAGIPVGQAAERIGDRLARVVFVDAEVPQDGQSFVSVAGNGQEVAVAVARNGGCWPPPAAGDFAGQGLTDEQVARIVAGATPHPGASLTEPAVLGDALPELPVTYVKCLLDWPEPYGRAAELLAGERWRLVELETGHWPMFSQPHELALILQEL